MNSIPAQEIKRRGVSALYDLLKQGPVHIIRNNRPTYVVLSQEQFAQLSEARGLWEWVERPARVARRKKEIDLQLRAQREDWG